MSIVDAKLRRVKFYVAHRVQRQQSSQWWNAIVTTKVRFTALFRHTFVNRTFVVSKFYLHSLLTVFQVISKLILHQERFTHPHYANILVRGNRLRIIVGNYDSICRGLALLWSNKWSYLRFGLWSQRKSTSQAEIGCCMMKSSLGTRL